MFCKKTLLASVVTALAFLSGAASATQKWLEVDDQVVVAPFKATADIVDEWDVYDSKGNRIGEVEEVVGTTADTPAALVVDFDDKSRYGAADVVVPLDQIEQVDRKLVLKADPAAIASMEKYYD